MVKSALFATLCSLFWIVPVFVVSVILNLSFKTFLALEAITYVCSWGFLFTIENRR
jgi:hypothetical protein